MALGGWQCFPVLRLRFWRLNKLNITNVLIIAEFEENIQPLVCINFQVIQKNNKLEQLRLTTHKSISEILFFARGKKKPLQNLFTDANFGFSWNYSRKKIGKVALRRVSNFGSIRRNILLNSENAHLRIFDAFLWQRPAKWMTKNWVNFPEFNFLLNTNLRGRNNNSLVLWSVHHSGS